jgi:hypothetical protein
MSFEDIQRTVIHIEQDRKYGGDSNNTMEEELDAEFKEDDAILKGNKDLD